MKKILTLILLSCVVMVASSCKKEVTEVTEVTEVVQPNQTIIYTVKASDWGLSDDNTTWSTSLEVPEIDNYFHNNGAVLVYISFDGGVVYEQVPENYNGRSFSFSHSVGGIQIDSQAFDGGEAFDNPGAAKVKVVLVDSQP